MNRPQMARHYKRSPLVEAVFEFMPISAELDDAGLAALRLASSEYQDETVEQGVLQRVDFSPTGPVSSKTEARPPRYKRMHSSKTMLVQFSRELFCFNALVPYTHYLDYKPEIERLFSEYVRAARPRGVLFLGQRYLNRIMLPTDAADPSEYLALYPRMSPSTRRQKPMFLQIEAEQFAEGGHVLATLSYQGPDGATKRPTYVLDLYARTGERPAIDFLWPNVSTWHDFAHDALTKAFESSIEDEARSLFGLEESR
jgi:uncharacterized protein (TIGR04255 family)